MTLIGYRMQVRDGMGREAIFVLGVRKRPVAVAFVSLHAALRLPALLRHALNVYHIRITCARSLARWSLRRTTSSCSESKPISHLIVAAARACAASSPARSGSVSTTTLLLLALSRGGGGWTYGRPLSAAGCFHVLPPRERAKVKREDVGMWREAQRQRVLAQHKLFAYVFHLRSHQYFAARGAGGRRCSIYLRPCLYPQDWHQENPPLPFVKILQEAGTISGKCQHSVKFPEKWQNVKMFQSRIIVNIFSTIVQHLWPIVEESG
ncbi:hypothetical protein FB451DRAFT_1182876 [Mycena latifolia]|nr:hypothetical protein FB451DRAFT_1182876 [Mycena latifolia]